MACGCRLADGRCAIGINVKPGKSGDVSNGVAMSRAAQILVQTCVIDKIAAGEQARGGFVDGIGKLTSLFTRNYRCYSPFRGTRDHVLLGQMSEQVSVLSEFNSALSNGRHY